MNEKSEAESAPQAENLTNSPVAESTEKQTNPENSCDKDPLLLLQAEKDALYDKYVRLVAEFDNYKKRTARELTEFMQTASKSVVLSMLSVVDDMQRAETQIKTTDDIASIKEGVLLVFEKMRHQLKHIGVTPMNSKHTPFNTDWHEAITEIPAPDPAQKDTVVDVVEEGYLMNGKIIRFAKVVVGK